jgi:hypothetical protein
MYFSPISRLLCIMNEAQLVSMLIKMRRRGGGRRGGRRARNCPPPPPTPPARAYDSQGDSQIRRPPFPSLSARARTGKITRVAGARNLSSPSPVSLPPSSLSLLSSLSLPPTLLPPSSPLPLSLLSRPRSLAPSFPLTPSLAPSLPPPSLLSPPFSPAFSPAPSTAPLPLLSSPLLSSSPPARLRVHGTAENHPAKRAGRQAGRLSSLL